MKMSSFELNKFMLKVEGRKHPKHWKEFITKNTISCNLILKSGNRAFCTHCQKYFDKKINSDKYKKVKCPICNNKYYARNSNLKNYSFINDFAFYTKVDKKIVLRVFQIESVYDKKTKSFIPLEQEYLRFVPGIGLIINDSVSFYMWNMKVFSDYDYTEWHIYTGNKGISNIKIYPYSEKKLYKGTNLEYAPIKEFMEKYPYYNKYSVMNFASNPSFEYLWKMGLYNLSSCAKYFKNKGSFYKTFKLDKSFQKFMIENDINYSQYKILKLTQKKDMDFIYKYTSFDYNYLSFMKKQGLIYNFDIVAKYSFEIYTISKICEYVPLKKFLNYNLGTENIYIYRDYLIMSNELGYNYKSKKDLFPEDLIERHDKLQREIKINKDILTEQKAYIRYLELSKYTYNDRNFIVFPPTSVDDFIKESKEQDNCVATAYLNKHINKETEIFFMRKMNNMEKSFITIETKNNKVIQKELPKHSKDFKLEHLEFINKWCEYRKFIDLKEKYHKKTKIEKKKYASNIKVA